MKDNCVIAHEVMMKMKGLKNDMSKAYHRVSLNGLNRMLDKMRFPPKCRHWVMQYVTTFFLCYSPSWETYKIFQAILLSQTRKYVIPIFISCGYRVIVAND